MKIIKTFEMYKPDRPIYEIDFDAKYLAPLGDTATTLVGFQSDAGLTVTPQVAVGGALSSGVIKFSAEAPTAAGPIRVAAQILTAAGRKKSGMVEITIEPEIVFTT